MNPVLGYGVQLGLIMGVTHESKMKWLKLSILYTPFSIIILFSLKGIIEGETDIDNMIKVIWNSLIYTQVSFVLEDLYKLSHGYLSLYSFLYNIQLAD